MKKVIHLEKITLKCDACGEYEKPVTLSREWIDMPCPKCGANLLTEGDYKAGERLINLVNMINRILGPLILYRVTFSDGFVARAYGLRDIGKPGNSGSVDIGRPARAAVEKYRLHFFPEIGMAAYSEPVPEIVELRSIDNNCAFDPSLANAGTADMREGTWA